MPSYLRRIFPIFGTFCFGVALAAILLEGLLRIWSGVLAYRSWKTEKISDKDFVVLTLGESTTAGDELDTWPSQLEQLLREKYPTRSIRVVNKAIPGTNTSVLVGNLEKQIQSYHPSMLVSMMGINDNYQVDFKHSVFIPDSHNDWFLSMKVMRILGQYIRVTSRDFYNLHINRDAKAMKAMGDSFRIQGEYERSEHYLKRSISLNPKDANTDVLLALLYRDMLRNNEAELALLDAKRVAPLADGVYVELGNFYRDNGNLNKADDMYKTALFLNPDSWLANGEYGTYLYWYKEENDLAATYYEKSIRLNPSFEAIYLELADIYRKQNQPDRAILLYQRVLAMNANNVIAKRELTRTMHPGLPGEVAGASTQNPDTIIDTGLHPMTENNYRRMVNIAKKYSLPVIAVSYPLRSAKPLRELFSNNIDTTGVSVTVADNEATFREALRHKKYDDLFTDHFAGNFGHATRLGNSLIAQQVAGIIESSIMK